MRYQRPLHPRPPYVVERVQNGNDNDRDFNLCLLGPKGKILLKTFEYPLFLLMIVFSLSPWKSVWCRIRVYKSRQDPELVIPSGVRSYDSD